VTLSCGLTEPGLRTHDIFSYAFTLTVNHSQTILGFGVALARRRSKPFTPSIRFCFVPNPFRYAMPKLHCNGASPISAARL
jgi:hypothetical protein